MELSSFLPEFFNTKQYHLFIHGQKMELSRFLREFFNAKSYHLYSWIMYSRIMQKFLATTGRYCTGFWPHYIQQESKTLAYVVLGTFDSLRRITTWLGTISSIQSTVRWLSDHHQMALRSVPTSHLLELLVKKK